MPDIYHHRLYYDRFLSENINLHDEAQFAISSESTERVSSYPQPSMYAIVSFYTV